MSNKRCQWNQRKGVFLQLPQKQVNMYLRQYISTKESFSSTIGMELTSAGTSMIVKLEGTIYKTQKEEKGKWNVDHHPAQALWALTSIRRIDSWHQAIFIEGKILLILRISQWPDNGQL